MHALSHPKPAFLGAKSAPKTPVCALNARHKRPYEVLFCTNCHTLECINLQT
jgi:hypothetical protein